MDKMYCNECNSELTQTEVEYPLYDWDWGEICDNCFNQSSTKQGFDFTDLKETVEQGLLLVSTAEATLKKLYKIHKAD